MEKKEAKIISVVNTKGGVGKSTLIVNLAIMFKTIGLKTLVIDVDDQMSLSDWFSDFRSNEENLSVICLGIKHLNRISGLAKGYDIVLLDGKGSRDRGLSDYIARTIIQASNFSIIPIIPDYFNKKAADSFLDEVVLPLAEIMDLKAGILIYRVKERTNLSKAYVDYLTSIDEIGVFKNKISDLAIFPKSIAKGTACFEEDPKDKGSLEFIKFFNELIKIIGVKNELVIPNQKTPTKQREVKYLIKTIGVKNERTIPNQKKAAKKREPRDFHA